MNTGGRILVIEDERDLMEVIKARLDAAGYSTIVAYDGQEGLDKARKDNPDLIILDLMLPKIDGYKVCAMLKHDQRYMKIPIVMLTARAQESDEKLGKEAGADAYITKPFEPKALLEKIEGLLATK